MDAGEQKALFASLEKTQMRRFEFLESLKQRFEGNREDEGTFLFGVGRVGDLDLHQTTLFY